MFKSAFSKTALLVAGVMMAGAVSAKEMKIGYVDVQAVAAKIPQSAALQETIKKEFGQRVQDVQKLEKDINFNIEKLRRDGPTMSEAQQEELKKTLTTQRQQYEEQGRTLQEDLRVRQAEERNKLMGLVKTAIDAIAKKDNYDLILNAQAGVFVKPEYDISDAVVAQVSKAK